MKKLLNISVIAALAILPLAANADPMAQVTITNDDAARMATTAYVKGAYNALVDGKQDKLTTDQINAIGSVTTLSGDVSQLKTTVGNASSGLVKDVADLKTAVGDENSGLTKAVADNTTAIAGKQNALTEAQQNAVNSGITAAKVTGYDDVASAVNNATTGLATKAAAAEVTALGNRVTTAEGKISTLETASATHATKTGVTNTISASTVTVPALLQWGDTTTQNVAANITGATYTETAGN